MYRPEPVNERGPAPGGTAPRRRRRGLVTGTVLILLPVVAGCPERPAPWDSGEARAVSEDIAAARAALVGGEPVTDGVTLQPARGPAVPIAAVPARLRPGAAPGSAPAPETGATPEPGPAVPAPTNPPTARRTEATTRPARPPVQPIAGPEQVDVGDPYGTLDWTDAVSLIQGPRPEARLVAARVLGMLGLDAERVEFTRHLLLEATTDADAGVRTAAQQALKRVGG